MSRLLLPSAAALGALAFIATAPAVLAQSSSAPAPAPAPHPPAAATPAPHAPAAATPAPRAPAAAAQPHRAAAPAERHASAPAPADEPSLALQRAELAELGPHTRAEVMKRATHGNTIRGVLETMLLNGMELKDPASRIVALDFGRGVAVMQSPQQGMQLIHFDKNTLAIRT